MEKTQVMRMLDKNKIEYNAYTYDGVVSGMDVANYLKLDPSRMYKTLVTISKEKNIYVFLVSVDRELDLKKAASVVGEKNLDMLPSKELLSITGCIHGGCSPIGMKKTFKTVIDETATNYDTIYFSAGKIGYEVELSLDSLSKIIDFSIADITK